MNRRYIMLGIALLSVLFLIGCKESQTPETLVLTNQQEGISVTGTGKVAAQPDIAILNLGIQSQEETVALAQSKAAEAMNKVLSALTGSGIAARDIQTQRFSIQVITRYDNNTNQEIIIGYQVTNTVSAKIRSLTNTGIIIDAAAAAGGDLTRIQGITFSIEEPTSLYNQAREKAMNDAKAKADQIADLADITLGKPIFVSESISFPINQDSRIEAPAAPTTPISIGELEISASVQVVYSISK
jgi:uncharacterized protein YggE